MIDYMIGTVSNVSDGIAVIEAGAIGYQLLCSLTTIAELSASYSEVKVYTHLSVTDNGLFLYGFYDRAERELFLKLTSVTKVGPKVALSLLSLYPAAQLIQHIVNQDAKALSQANGVGQKLADSIVFNLKGKFDLVVEEEWTVPDLSFADAAPKEEAISALIALGFDRPDSIKYIQTIYEDGLSSKELISMALKQMNR